MASQTVRMASLGSGECEAKARELQERVTISPWFSADTKLGVCSSCRRADGGSRPASLTAGAHWQRICLHLDEPQCFGSEAYAVDCGFPGTDEDTRCTCARRRCAAPPMRGADAGVGAPVNLGHVFVQALFAPWRARLAADGNVPVVGGSVLRASAVQGSGPSVAAAEGQPEPTLSPEERRNIVYAQQLDYHRSQMGPHLDAQLERFRDRARQRADPLPFAGSMQQPPTMPVILSRCASGAHPLACASLAAARMLMPWRAQRCRQCHDAAATHSPRRHGVGLGRA